MIALILILIKHNHGKLSKLKDIIKSLNKFISNNRYICANIVVGHLNNNNYLNMLNSVKKIHLKKLRKIQNNLYIIFKKLK